MEIPGYKILDTLGQGGMATVYLAIQKSFEREVALKVMSSALLQTDPSFGERFIREARIVSRLVHPNIVTVFDAGECDGHHFLSMEYISGKDLKDQRIELSLPKAIRVIKEVALALDYAGKKGYVHRDVKPENIMLDGDDGRALLMDFGIAKVADHVSDMTQTGTAIGTPHYMSPEQAKGLAVDSRSDLYSLGVVLYLLLTGYVPFDAESAVAVGIKHVSEPIPLLPSHLGVFQPVIDRVLAKNPADRYQQGGELIAALSAITPMRLEAIESVAEEMAQSMGIPRDMPEGMAKDELKQRLQGRGEAGTKIEAARPDEKGTYSSEAATITGGGIVDNTVIAAQISSSRHAGAHEEGSAHFSEVMYQLESEQHVEPKKHSIAWLSVKWLFILAIVLSGLLLWRPQLQPRWLPVALKPILQQGRQRLVAYLDLTHSQTNNKNQPSSLVSDPSASSSITPLSVTSKTAVLAAEGHVQYRNKAIQDSNKYPELDRLRDLRPVVAVVSMDAVNESVGENTGISVENSVKDKAGEGVDTADLVLQTLGETQPQKEAQQNQEAAIQKEIIQKKIIHTLAVAERYLKNNALSRPAGENALEAYQSIFVLEPNNIQAKAGINKLVRRYGVMATQSQRRGQLSQAGGYLQQALQIAPGDSALLKQQQQLALQIQQRLEKKRKLKKLETQAQRYFQQGQWLAPKNHNALKSYRALQRLNPNHLAARQGLKNIEQGLVEKADDHMLKENFSAATEVLQQAEVAFPQSKLLEGQRQMLIAAIDARTPKIPQLLVSDQALTSLDITPSSALQVGSRVIYIGFQYSTFQQQNSVVQAVLYDGAHSLKIAQKAVIVSGAEGQKFFSIERPVQGFAAGGYSIDLILADTLLASSVFHVVP